MLAAPEVSTVLEQPVHLSDNYVELALDRLVQGRGTHVVTLNAEMCIQAETNTDLAAVIRSAELVIPDGAGVVLYLRLRGRKVQRCPGIEFSEQLLRRYAGADPDGKGAFFFGGKPGVAEVAVQRWQQEMPELAIAGVQHGYLSPEEEEELLNQLRDRQPAIVLVGLGVPRQEFWIAKHRHLCPQSTWIGVGGSFDIWAGVKDRAPSWLRDNHLEWAYRLYQEPWRWRRMLSLPKFAWKALVK